MIEALIRVPRNDFRGAVEPADQLARDVTAIRGFTAEVVESPLDLSPKQGLQGRLEEKDDSGSSMDLRFVMRVVHDRGAPG